jgi:hypothetical protein
MREIPASLGQRLLWLLEYYRGDDGALNCPLLLRMRGALNTSALSTAVDGVMRRHEALRTTFVGRGRRMTQVIHDPRPLHIAHVDLTQMVDPEVAVQQAIADELRTGIDAATWPLRVTLWRVSEQDHVLCINMHHFVTDAWSCSIVFRELCALFDCAVGGACEPPQLGWQYRQFVDWQQQLLKDNGLRVHQEYWHRQLMGAQLPTLPHRESQAQLPERHTAVERVYIDCEVGGALRRLARLQRTTLFAVMLAVYYTLLHHLTGQTDLAVASMFANRLRPEVQNTVGFLANMVILRTRFPETATFIDLVREAHTTIIGAFMHQALPYQLLPLDTMPAGSVRADNLVFQIMAEPVYTTRMANIEAEVLVPDGVGSRFDLELALVPQDGGFRAVLFYSRAHFDPAFASAFISGYASLAAAHAATPAAPLAEARP